MPRVPLAVPRVCCHSMPSLQLSPDPARRRARASAASAMPWLQLMDAPEGANCASRNSHRTRTTRTKRCRGRGHGDKDGRQTRSSTPPCHVAVAPTSHTQHAVARSLCLHLCGTQSWQATHAASLQSASSCVFDFAEVLYDAQHSTV
jgi:hypothetical protein